MLRLLPPLLAGAVTRYTVILVGNKAGFETSTRKPDGSLALYYEFNDRGRGPKVTEQVVLDNNRIPIRVKNTGNDYLKAPVEEQRYASTWCDRRRPCLFPLSLQHGTAGLG